MNAKSSYTFSKVVVTVVIMSIYVSLALAFYPSKQSWLMPLSMLAYFVQAVVTLINAMNLATWSDRKAFFVYWFAFAISLIAFLSRCGYIFTTHD